MFDAAREAKSRTQMQADKETLQTAVVVAYDVNKSKVDKNILEDNLSGWQVRGEEGIGPYTCISPNKSEFVVDIEGNITDKSGEDKPDIGELELLEKYFLGIDKQGKSIVEILNFDTNLFIGDSNTIPDADTSVILLSIESKQVYMVMYVEYNNKAYAVQVGMDEQSKTKKVELVYEPTRREGQKVLYSYDGKEENKKEWTIIYDGENIEIVSPEVIDSLSLGYGDMQAIGQDNSEKSIYSYNNAISKLNNYCAEKVTNSNKISVRSIGSNPNNPTVENNTLYESDNLVNWVGGAYNKIGKSGDTNYEQDFIRMSFHKELNIGTEYWLASRLVFEYPSFSSFFVRYIDYDGMLIGGGNAGLWTVYENNVTENSNMYGVRPIVKLPSNYGI